MWQNQFFVLYTAQEWTLIILTPVPVISLLTFLHPSMSLICTYVCSVLLRLEKQGRQEAGAVLSPGEDGPVWPERAEEWLGENQTLSARWVGCAELPSTLVTELFIPGIDERLG